MENPEQTLIIILAVTLSVFLLVAIIALIKIIQVITHLQNIIEKAEKLADKAESVGEFFKQSAGPIALAKLFASVGQAMFDRRKHRKGKA
ncbi:MAG: hypothetical protein V4702_03660 [Patescibacteria group bacterium]